MQTKKLSLSIALSLLCTTQILADVPVFSKDSLEVSLGGEVNAAFGARVHNKAGGAITSNNNDVAINTLAAVYTSVLFPKVNGWTSGVRSGFRMNTINAAAASKDYLARTYIYVEHPNVGRAEVGTKKSAANSMKISGASVAVAAGGIDGMWPSFLKIDSTDGVVKGDNFLDAHDLAVSEGSHNDGAQEKYRKITLYSPLMNGFKIGMSYGPDAANIGNRTLDPSANKLNNRAKNVVSGGMSWEHTFNNKGEFKVSLVGDYASYNPMVHTRKNNLPPLTSPYKYNPYQAYMIGALYRYDKIAIAASYGNQFKKNIAKNLKDLNASNTYLYTVGVSYKFDKADASIGYPYSNKNSNIFQLASLGLGYHPFTWLTPYAEVAYFNADQKKHYVTEQLSRDETQVDAPSFDENKKGKNSGTALILGVKVVF